MEDRYNGTVTAILEAGKKEFLTYGYEKASLRRIAKEASVTTGAIYGYFPGKKALFDALTSDTAEELLDLYRKEHRDFAALPPEQQPARLNEITEQYIPWMVNYIYDHFEVFKLLLCCGAQEARDRYFDRLAAVEEQSCRDFIKAMELRWMMLLCILWSAAPIRIHIQKACGSCIWTGQWKSLRKSWMITVSFMRLDMMRY